MPRRPWLTLLFPLLTGAAAWGADPATASRVYSLRIVLSVDLTVPGHGGGIAPITPTPPPTPVPIAPTVEPSPQASPEPAYALVIYDRSARTPALAAILDSTTIAARLKASGAVWRNAPIDDPVTVGPAIRKAAESLGLPALVVVRGAKVVDSIGCPTTEADVIAKVKDTLGVK